ncbi:hypothetical protein SAMN06295937_101036 [Sphingopyxis flava]|uniref:Uncharacterized protein n=1 Tax=Sphingopyxis flava TaxID=1507287 RepID=A0A1T5CG29_9SPHN|nr:hypothetical protein SAMN06295937_101036 [Sphingopyxis flava]
MSGGSIALSAAAHVPPLHTSKSLQQLCARWQHNLDVGFTPERFQISFPSEA